MNTSDMYKKELDVILEQDSINWQKLKNRNVLITGATGLIGLNLVNLLCYASKKKSLNCSVTAQIRSEEKAQKLFNLPFIDYSQVHYICSDIIALNVCDNVDYIVHAAAMTSSRDFVERPVEIICTNVNGTNKVLEIARENVIKGMVYLSTMEVYGHPQSDDEIFENTVSNLDSMEIRSSYPESKRMCENLCLAYDKEYDVPVSIARLTQTFGYGVRYNDQRVFAEFARCAIEKKDIVLHTMGDTKRNYLYVSDAISAILHILLSGEQGQAYNVANKDTYCSIYEMAQLVAEKCAGNSIKVDRQLEDVSKFGYAPVLKMNLNTDKLEKLGWKPRYSLDEMFERLIGYM